ncbi:MAG: DeoR/GlpR family DNA-binding transcription regulator [Anaerolineae bacterium]|nr:DeoR/GlpR family DNA-binding transcription regulator [Anaerolineae bacterium]
MNSGKVPSASSDEGSRLAVERQRIILDILEREGVVRTTELKELLKVSAVTIRSDLRELESTGACEIIWGGAISKRPPVESEQLLLERSHIHVDEKRRIGASAAQLVEVGQTIILDAGTTTVEIITHLPRDMDYLRVVTPALNVAVAAAYFPNVELVMTGGFLRHLTRSLVGDQVLRSLETINADWTFLATGAFSIEYGVTTSNILEVEVKRTMAKRGSRVALLADSSKFGQKRSLVVVPMDRIDVLITDRGLSKADARRIEALGVEVMRV